MTPRRSLLLILALGLAVRLENLHGMSQHPVAEYQFRSTEADMSLAYEWSGHILRGDVLGREPVHQYTVWVREIAPLETWERWWGGAEIFHTAPLYAYTVAAFRFLLGDHFWQIGLSQALLGLANVALVFLLAARLFGGAVPALAALGAALYGPFQLHELFLLRDTLGVTVSLLMLWALARCDDAAPLVAAWMFRRFHADRRALGRAGFWFLAGLGLGLAPLVGRNLWVGAPPFSLSTCGIEAFIRGNAPDSSGFGGSRLP